MPIDMYLFPWREDMRTELEHRVYCPPPLAQGNDSGKSAEAEISAISQYSWHTPWYHATSESKHEGIKR